MLLLLTGLIPGFDPDRLETHTIGTELETKVDANIGIVPVALCLVAA